MPDDLFSYMFHAPYLPRDHHQSKSETLYETCKPSHGSTLLARSSRRPRSNLAINERQFSSMTTGPAFKPIATDFLFWSCCFSTLLVLGNVNSASQLPSLVQIIGRHKGKLLYCSTVLMHHHTSATDHQARQLTIGQAVQVLFRCSPTRLNVQQLSKTQCAPPRFIVYATESGNCLEISGHHHGPQNNPRQGHIRIN